MRAPRWAHMLGGGVLVNSKAWEQLGNACVQHTADRNRLNWAVQLYCAPHANGCIQVVVPESTGVVFWLVLEMMVLVTRENKSITASTTQGALALSSGGGGGWPNPDHCPGLESGLLAEPG